MTRIGRLLSRPEARWVIAIFALSLVVRLALIAYVHPSPRDGRYDDSVFYDSAARHLAAGDGYVFDPTVWKAADGSAIYPDQTALTATALWPPGYPATLAVIYRATGNAQWAARLFNVLVGSLTPALVFLIARRLFDLLAAASAGVALAVLPGHVLFTGVLLTETYFGFLVALVLAICVYFVFDRDRPNLPLLAGLGALVTFTGYVRGEFLAFGAVLALFVAIRWGRRAALPLAALALGAAVVVTPWVVRNQVQMGQALIGTTGAGSVAYQGHGDTTEDGPSLEAARLLAAPYADLSHTDLEIHANSDGKRLAREWALDHKLEELQLIPMRLFHLFKSDNGGIVWIQSNKAWFGKTGTERLTRASDFTFYGLMALALAGAPFWVRRDLRTWLVFSIVPLYLFLFGVLFVGDPRYHYALYIPFAIFAGPAIAEIWRMTGERRRTVAGGRTLAPAREDRAPGR